MDDHVTLDPPAQVTRRDPEHIQDVIIVGGGIGGLAAAVALRHVGVRAIVFERAERIDALGAGIGLAHNALMCLDELGVLNAVRERGQSCLPFLNRTWNGRVLSKNDWSGVWIHRADLQNVLLASLGHDAVRLNMAFTRFAQDSTGVTAYFSDGTRARGDVLIAADGVRSAVRTQLLGPSSPRYTGSIAWRGVTAFDHPDLQNNLEFWGRGSRFGIFPIGRGYIYWYGTRRVPEGFVLPQDTRKRDLLSFYREWCDPVGAAISATPADSIIQTDIYDRKPISRWVQSRIALLGDSAHAMTADAGQGCAQVFEDAIVLGRCVQRYPDLVSALHKYERFRLARANSVLRESHRYSQISKLNTPIACLLRDSLFIKRMPQRMKIRRQSRLRGIKYWAALGSALQ